jgi:hypothetical protein
MPRTNRTMQWQFYPNVGPGAPRQAAVSSLCRKMVARHSRELHLSNRRLSLCAIGLDHA